MVPRLLALGCVWLTAGVSLGAEAVDYLRDIKPLLSARCTTCHGALRQKGGLRLDAARLIQAGGDGGPVLTPGNSSESPLIQHLLGTHGLKRMPPKEEGEPLAPEKIALLQAWIDAGAKAPLDEPVPENPRDHWAFRLPVKSPVPTNSDPKAVDEVVAQVSQPAVSQRFQPADVSNANARSDFGRAADWKSATQQTGSLRYLPAARRSGAPNDLVNGLAGDPAWRSNPIDAFLSAAHRRQGLKASAPTSQDF